jgi:hypothetical protein
MRKFIEGNTTKLPEIVFVKDDSLARFKEKILFPDKVARAKEDFKNIGLPPRTAFL